ncbi:MAG: hypothetical protein LBL71_01465 [Endomicrobium sp.]|jgi:hypothetical protein|nr:hypothetical protein [Endomicrobium sp.]
MKKFFTSLAAVFMGLAPCFASPNYTTLSSRIIGEDAALLERFMGKEALSKKKPVLVIIHNKYIDEKGIDEYLTKVADDLKGYAVVYYVVDTFKYPTSSILGSDLPPIQCDRFILILPNSENKTYTKVGDLYPVEMAVTDPEAVTKWVEELLVKNGLI